MQTNAMPLPLDPTAPWWWPRAAYVHVPFCAHHCGYCDFAVAVGQDEQIDGYLDALSAELAQLETPQSVTTLFLGGGTPTYLSAGQLARLLTIIRQWLTLEPGCELSIEANPGTLDADKIAVLAEHGVNRVSLGAQSFAPEMLRVLERDHQPADVPRAVERIRQRIPAVAIDLIFGVPGQTRVGWEHDLRAVLALQPEHVSTYGLTYEKGTRLWKQQRAGQIQALDEESELALYLHGIDTLSAAGFEHYEISNFARPGQRSRHNQVYWANEAHFGFGMGAARYLESRRELNSRSLATYMQRVLAGRPATFQSEMLPPRERAFETIGQNLRRAEGVLRERFQTQTGFDLEELVGETSARLAELGYLSVDAEGMRLTRQGRCVADSVIGECWRSA